MQRYRSWFRWRHLLWPPRFRPYAVPVQMIDDTKSCSPQEGTTTCIVCDWEKWIESWVANNLHPSDISSARIHLSDISANQVPHDRLIPLVSFLLLSHFLLQPSKKVTKILFFQNFGKWRETIWFCMHFCCFFVATVFTCSFFHRAELPQRRRKAHLKCLKWPSIQIDFNQKKISVAPYAVENWLWSWNDIERRRNCSWKDCCPWFLQSVLIVNIKDPNRYIFRTFLHQIMASYFKHLQLKITIIFKENTSLRI